MQQSSITAVNDVDPTIWRAIAGKSVQIPTVGSRVYYFPQGHSEHAANSGSPIFLNSVIPPFILCRVLSVHYLADTLTDEAFAKIFLVPIINNNNNNENNGVTVNNNNNNEDEDLQNDDVVSFVKILTPSDANNGGGFSVPRFCADSIFPRLNFVAEPPVQNLTIRDIHGTEFEFRHIYRGTPRRHLLTTGWSKFVNSKKLVAGDSAVFIRKIGTGELYIGVRRAIRGNNNINQRWTNSLLKREEIKISTGETGEGRVGTEVVEAAEMAARGMGFEVSCYPRAGWADFVVRAEIVEASSSVFWSVGTRVKMAVETEDSCRTACFQGTVSCVVLPESGPWRGSPWRMLQITWDEPEVMQHAKRVNPWQVECVLPTPQFHSGIPPSKKIKLPNGLLPDGKENLFFPMTGFSNPPIGLCSPSMGNCTSFPVGMQGARQNQICLSSLTNVKSNNNLGLCTNNSLDEEIKPKLESVSTKLNIGSSYSDNLSPDSQSSVHFWDNELVTKPGSSSLTNVRVNSFQLFGKVIHVEHFEGGFDGFGCSENDSIQVFKEIDGAFKSNVSPNKPCIKLFDNLDVQHQRASAVESCSLYDSYNP
ncbi:auxin response factor 17 [Lycium ferocissimum]|uniref:auxin response factor 17 n=1 Tax=Lycium ferocissimum TaxID=112874 RepID=UPI002814EAB0|nr:auxin response factor 17 [Lycium ferocissimum]